MCNFLFHVGPGCSSLGVGAFSENGPFRPDGEVLVRNEYSWNRGNAINIIAVATGQPKKKKKIVAA